MQYSLLLSMLYIFRAFFRPSSGAQKLYTQHLVYVMLASVGELELQFQLTHAIGGSKQA
jgi:hypothetical protein